jgi:hypothetical protein
MTILEGMRTANPTALSRLAGAELMAAVSPKNHWDNRPSWDSGPRWDSRPTWDNWSRR